PQWLSFSVSLNSPTTVLFCFFFTDPAPPAIYTLSLHDALPISFRWRNRPSDGGFCKRWCGLRGGWDLRAGSAPARVRGRARRGPDRKSTRLNSSHRTISYAVFCLKKKKKHTINTHKTRNPYSSS